MVKTKTCSVVLLIIGIPLGSLLYPADTKAIILSGIDEPTGNASEDVFIAKENNTTITPGSNQTINDNVT
jgi:hypothetical protein